MVRWTDGEETALPVAANNIGSPITTRKRHKPTSSYDGRSTTPSKRQTMSISAKATSGGMSLLDVELCRGALRQLMSSKYPQNGVFLQPFDLYQVPGYLDVCPKVMDLQTLKYNLEDGVYSSRKDFFDDCFLIFQNAIDYHSDKDTKWISNGAVKMLKIAKKEEAKAEKKAGNAAGMDDSNSIYGAPEPPLKKTTKIKLKLPTGGGSKSSAGAAASTPGSTTSSGGSKPKVTIKATPKTPPSGVFTGTGTPASSSGSAEPKPKKPRLKLNMKSTKIKSEPTDDATAPTPKSPTSASSSSGNKKINIKKQSVSQGKQLPKGVASPEPPAPAATPAASVKTEPTTTKTESKKTTKKKGATKAMTGGGHVAGEKTTGKVATGKVAPISTEKAKTKLKIKASTGSGVDSKTTSRLLGNAAMTPTRKAQCSKVLNGLKRRQAKNISWFLQPVTDKMIRKDYIAKIKNPMDLSTVQTKLERDEYATVGAFVLDIRRIFGNCLQFNTLIEKGSLRPVAVEVLETAEQLMSFFLAKPEYPQLAYPPLIFCWKLCLNVLDTLYNLTNPDDKIPIAFFFLFPIAFYFDGRVPSDYKQAVPKPMDFGTITGKLVEGQYEQLGQFEADCKLVFSNCHSYNAEHSPQLCDHARQLSEALDPQLQRLKRYISSPAGQAAHDRLVSSATSTSLPKPSIPLLLDVLTEIRKQTYTDKDTKMTEPAMVQFEKPISVAATPDYTSYVRTPMDLQTVERKIKSSQYATPEDFEYDMLLIFENCIVYNKAKNVPHLVALAKSGRTMFNRIFKAKMKQFDDPSSVSSGTIRKDLPVDSGGEGPSKKLKIDLLGASRPAPRISISANTISEAQRLIQSRKPPKPGEASAPKPNQSDQPVPVHIAIQRVKERFPLRRPVKSLQGWESSCLRFYKELMKHPWLSAARPQFIFHVPVTILFPSLREVYAMKIQRPMDLTTVECTLLAGGFYAVPEDFVNDVALVFVNAIRFNKEGRDIGDPLSCAYYDASVHLLNYSRWLSLEVLSEFVQGDDHVDEPEKESLPIASWKLTTGNKKKARSEMEEIVLNEHIEKSLEGDGYTWTEMECEKLIKSLRHQSDFKYMKWYIYTTFPADYANFIARPMDVDRVQKTLRKRQYDKFGNVIDDLRLIFSNAMKYNFHHAGSDNPSGHAYEAATIMADKLEISISKMMISVADRIERERIDHNNAEREIAAAERAEDEAIRAQWKSQSDNKDGPSSSSAPSTRVEATQRIQNKRRIILRRKSDTDFEVPFFDENDDGQHERSYFEVMKQQKATFERQQAEMKGMRRSAVGIGQSLYTQMMHQELALRWVAAEQKKLGMLNAVSPKKSSAEAAGTEADTAANQQKQGNGDSGGEASSVMAQLEAKDRSPLKIKFAKKAAVSRKQQHQAALDWDDENDEE